MTGQMSGGGANIRWCPSICCCCCWATLTTVTLPPWTLSRLLVKSDTLMLSASSFKDTAEQVGVGMSILAAALVHPYNRRHDVMCMGVHSSAWAASLVSAKYAVLPTAGHPAPTFLVPSHWSQNNKHQLHHPSYLLGCPTTKAELPNQASAKSC